jgi:VWFA-related protein
MSLTSQQAPQQAPGTVRVTTRLVLVDVIVADKDGRPVTDLRREDFTLLEDGKAQPISVFALEQAGASVAAEPAPLPPNVHSNRASELATGGPLNLILLDFLNTTAVDQAQARDHLLNYINNDFQRQQRTALLALTDRLYVLQDFTTDAEKLRAAAARAKVQDSAALTAAEPFQVAPDAFRIIPNAERHFGIPERMNMVMLGASADARAKQTLSALAAIAQAVAGYPGRKNLIWVSAGFPVAILAEQSKHAEFARNYGRQLEETSRLLAAAQVAIYPIDPRGLVGYSPDFEGGNIPGRGDIVPLVQQPGAPYRHSERGSSSRWQVQSSHVSLKEVAEDTGGRAFTNRSDIGAAVNEAVADGSHYYTLGYYPAERENDKFRKIEVRLARKGLQVRHRRSYQIADTREPSEEEQTQEMLAALASPLPATAIPFQARVALPAPGDPARVTAEFLIDARGVDFHEAADGTRRVSLDVLAAAVDADRNVDASAGQRLDFDFPAEVFARVQQQGLPYKLEVSVPAGSYSLRLLVRDNLSGRLGRLDLPLEIKKPL